MNPRIVCAACKCLITEKVIIGPRHFDSVMLHNLFHLQDALIAKDGECKAFKNYDKVEQGFIDQKGWFYTRTQAWKIAEENNQIIRRVGGDDKNGGTLYSENLY